MLSVYDLYDLSGVFKNIRSFPEYNLNDEVLKKVIEVLKSRNENNNLNQFRFALSPISNIDREMYHFAFVENCYVYFPSFLKNEGIYYLLETACNNLLQSVKSNNLEKIFDLADCLHNLPIIFVENHFSIPKSYWKGEVEYYRKKWDKNFLINEQKALK